MMNILFQKGHIEEKKKNINLPTCPDVVNSNWVLVYCEKVIIAITQMTHDYEYGKILVAYFNFMAICLLLKENS